MKTVYSPYILAVASVSFSLNSLSFQDTGKALYNQQNTLEVPRFFFTPLEYSNQNITFFLKKIYNDRRYPQHFLALNFLHVISGVHLAPQTEQPRRFIEKILSLFLPKLDNVYVNPYAFSDLLTQIFPAIARYSNQAEEKSRAIESIKECLGTHLLDNFEALKEDPESSLTSLAQSIYALSDASKLDEDISIRELQHTLHNFLSQALSNLIWSPADHLDTWKSVNTLSCQLEKFTEYYLIDEKMLDNLLWKLINRYGFFITLTAKDLDPSFFEGVGRDLMSERAALWLSEEREECVTTKLDYLKIIIMEGEIVSRVSALRGVDSLA